MYSKSSCAVKIGNKRTNVFSCKKGVRQGCPLSPSLFNIYINDIEKRLNRVNDSPITLDNGTNISCLLYADDIVIMSLSEEGLQKCLDELNKFCKEWKLTISMKKTKCITFQKQSKVNRRSSFFIDGKVVQNVSEFIYLGVNIKSNGSFHSTLKNLSCKASSAIFALNSRFKLNKIPVKAAFKLFDTTILPILTYGSEVWGIYLNMDSTKWDKCEIEQTHLQFCNHILGINRSSTNHLTRFETGRYPIRLHIDYKILTFRKHILSMPKDSIIYQALLMDKNLHDAGHIVTLTSYIKNLNLMNLRHVQGNNCNLENSNKKQIKSILSEYYKNISLSQLSVNPKARLYLQHKTEPRYEPYLDTITNRKIRVQYAKFRLGDHDLENEKGRHMKVERGNRYCKLCTTGDIGDELHLLFNCNKLYKSRPSFLNYMYKKF